MELLTLLRWVWYTTLSLTALLFLAAHLAPQRLARLQSMPLAFQLPKNLDLNFQTVLYATYHTYRANHVAHYVIVPAQIAWYIVLHSWHPALPWLMLGFLLV